MAGDTQEERQAVLNLVSDSVVYLDSRLQILWVNQAACDLIGESPGDIVGRQCYRVWKGRNDPCEVCPVRETFKTREPREMTSETFQGKRYLVRSYPLFSNNDYVESVVQVITAISTPPYQEEGEAWGESENSYRTIFETSGTAMFILEQDTTISVANTKCQELTGYLREEVEGKKYWTDFIHPQDVEWMKYYHDLRRTDPYAALKQYEFRFLDRYWNVHNAFLTIDVIPGTSKSVVSIMDISERKRAEEALQESERRYKQEKEYLDNVLQNSADAIVIGDEDGKILRGNKQALNLFGYGVYGNYGKHFSEFYADHEEMKRMLKHLKEKDSLRDYEISILHKDGFAIPCSLSVSLLRDKENNIVGSIGIIRDLREWKKAQQKLEEMSIYDHLTGLYNRAFFEEEMLRLEDGRYSPMGIVVCDVDGLKLINDTYGHGKGDELIKRTSDILRRCFRSSDILARIGGDEFAVLLTESDEETVRNCCERIRLEVDRYHRSMPQTGLSVSIGYAVALEPLIDMNGLFKQADDAMYKEKLQQHKSCRGEAVQALISTLRERDHVTEKHAGCLQEYSIQMGRLMNLSEERLNDLRLLSRFHDLGKVGIPDRTLFKPGRLTSEESKEMKRHSEIGYRIALSTSDLAPIADYILKHHEWWDGSGYPLGLQGKDIPLECRILALVDAYDSMTRDRPYRTAMSAQDARAELQKYAGIQFDPELVENFVKLLSSRNN